MGLSVKLGSNYLLINRDEDPGHVYSKGDFPKDQQVTERRLECNARDGDVSGRNLFKVEFYAPFVLLLLLVECERSNGSVH